MPSSDTPSHRNVVCGDVSESKCGALSESLVSGGLSESVCGDLSASGPQSNVERFGTI